MLYRRLDSLQHEIIEARTESVRNLARSKLAIGTQEELATEISKLEPLAKLALSKYEPGVLKSAQLNRDFESIFINVATIYRFLNKLYKRRKSHTEILGSDISILRQGVMKLLEDLKIYRELKLNQEWNDMRLLTFGDGRNASNSPLKAVVDNKSNKMISATAGKRSILGRTGLLKPIASVSYVTDIEDTNYTRSSYGPENAIDPDPTTFWAEVLLTERPAITTYNATDYNGFICQLVVDLKQTDLLNTIEILPFSLYPLTVLNIEYSTEGTSYTTVPGFVEVTHVMSWVATRSEPIVARYIRITLLQPNFRSLTLNVPKSTVVNNQLFNLIADEDLRLYFGDRVDSEIESREAEYSTNNTRVLDGLGKLQEAAASIAQPTDMLLPLERLAYNVSPVIDSKSVVGARLSPAENTDELLQYHKIEYIIGIAHIEFSLTNYHLESEYQSQKFVPNGTLQEIAIDPSTVNVVTLTDPNGSTFPAAVTEYSIEIAPFKSLPLVPYGDTTLWEVVKINPSTRKGRTRFETSAAAISVLRNGQPLDSSDYTFSNGELVISATKFILNAIYLLKYTPDAGQDVADIRSEFVSSKIERPEHFDSTDPSGRIVLSAPPYINYDIIYNTELFYKPSTEAKYYYRRDAGQTLIDGVVYGNFEDSIVGSLDVNGNVDTVGYIPADSPYLVLSSTTGLYDPTGKDVPGEIRIDNEVITYTSMSYTTLIGCTRGAKGTKRSTHTTNSKVFATGAMTYEPLTLYVNGIRARNITDYDKGEHPAFSASNRVTRVYHYIQAGPYIYLSAPLTKTSIDVSYNARAQYVKLIVKILQSGRFGGGYTAEVGEIKMLMKTTDI